MTQMRAKPDCLGSPIRTTIDTGRSMIAGGGAHYFFYIRILKYVGLSDLL